MKSMLTVVACLVSTLPSPARAQTSSPIPIDTAKLYFAQSHALCTADGGKLWGVSLCGPIMFVDAPSRSIVASEVDAKGVLRAKDGVFVGVLPADQNVANTAVEWSGVKWTQMLWPLPANERMRATIISHELYHRVQDKVGIALVNEGQNAHLDELDGRYYMQLEWRALARALEPGAESARRGAAKDALLFRAERYRTFPKAAAEERALERNEGLAEYTGVMVGNPTDDARTKMALHDLSVHVTDQTFVRSFAYATGPAYGMLLDRYVPDWRAKAKSGAALDAMLASALHVNAGVSIAALDARAAMYDGATLCASEVERNRQRQAQLAINRAKFVTGPRLTLKFQHMSVQFNPTTLQPLGDEGTVYPTIHVSDEWGTIDAKNGALMRPDWSALVVAAPKDIAGDTISGDGWTLALKGGWSLVPDASSGGFVLAPPH